MKGRIILGILGQKVRRIRFYLRKIKVYHHFSKKNKSNARS